MNAQACSKGGVYRRSSKARNLKASDSLLRFLEEFFIPTETANASKNYRSQCRRAIKSFGQFLGVSATLADLTTSNVKRFGEWITEHEPASQHGLLVRRLRSVWRYAASLDLAEPIDERDYNARSKTDLNSIEPAAIQGTVSHYFETVYLAQRLEESSKQAIENYRRAISQLNKSNGHPVLLGELNDSFIARHVDDLAKTGLRKGTIKFYRKHLLAVWRFAIEMGKVDQSSSRELKVLPVMIEGTVSHYFETAYLPKRLVGANKNGIDNYRRAIRRLNEFAGHPVMLSELNDSLIAQHLNDRVEAGLRKVTVNCYRRHLLAVWRLACDEGKVDRMPSIKKMREVHDEPDAWSEDEFRAILDHCECLADRRPISGLPASNVMRAVILLAYWTGLRRGTLWKLTWQNVDLLSRWVTVPGSMMKSGRGKRLRFGEDAAEALTAIRIEGANSLLPEMCRNRFDEYFGSVLESAGIPRSSRKVMTHLHKVRRTSATILANLQGIGAASTLLGHSSEQVTLRYIDPTKSPGNDMTAILPTLSGKGGAA